MKLLKLRDHLQESLHFAKMTSAHFGPHDEIVKKESRLYRETWLIPQIEQALEMVEEEIAKMRKKK